MNGFHGNINRDLVFPRDSFLVESKLREIYSAAYAVLCDPASSITLCEKAYAVLTEPIPAETIRMTRDGDM